MLALQHPNIVRLVEFTTEEPFLYLVMEFCDAGDLSGQMKNGPLTEERAHYFMMQLVAGLQILHSHKIIHRDLKPANLLLSTQRGDLILKIADFGFAKIMEDPNAMHNTYCGSPLYMAPEVLETSTYNSSADLWSVGAILYEMVCGDPPFNARSLMELLNKINVGTVDFPPTLSETCCSLISGLLKKDSTQRMSWTAFFTHSWLCDMFQSPPQNQSPPLSHNSTPIVPPNSHSSSSIQNTPSSSSIQNTPSSSSIQNTPTSSSIQNIPPQFSFKSLPTGNPVSPLNPPSTPNSSQTTMPPPTLLPNAMPPTPLPPTNPNPLPNPPMSFLPIKHSQANTTEKPLPSGYPQQVTSLHGNGGHQPNHQKYEPPPVKGITPPVVQGIQAPPVLPPPHSQSLPPSFQPHSQQITSSFQTQPPQPMPSSFQSPQPQPAYSHNLQGYPQCTSTWPSTTYSSPPCNITPPPPSHGGSFYPPSTGCPSGNNQILPPPTGINPLNPNPQRHLQQQPQQNHSYNQNPSSYPCTNFNPSFTQTPQSQMQIQMQPQQPQRYQYPQTNPSPPYPPQNQPTPYPTQYGPPHSYPPPTVLPPPNYPPTQGYTTNTANYATTYQPPTYAPPTVLPPPSPLYTPHPPTQQQPFRNASGGIYPELNPNHT